MRTILLIARRELTGYFATPVAWVFLVIYLALAGLFTFYLDANTPSGFFERGDASLERFFSYHPWLYMLLVPAISMRLWAEERSSGSIELLMTLPITLGQAVVGKFLAAWAFLIVALLGTLPAWASVAWLGDPDHGVILAGYVGTALLAGAYLAVGAAISALTRNQVVAFVLSLMASLAITLAGWPFVLDVFSGWAPTVLVDAVASLSFLTRFNALTRGVLEASDLMFFVTSMGFWLFVNAAILQSRKAD